MIFVKFKRSMDLGTDLCGGASGSAQVTHTKVLGGCSERCSCFD